MQGDKLTVSVTISLEWEVPAVMADFDREEEWPVLFVKHWRGCQPVLVKNCQRRVVLYLAKPCWLQDKAQLRKEPVPT